MTQAGRQGSPRNSSGRKGPERAAGQGGRGGQRGTGFGSGQRDFSKGSDRPFGDRSHRPPSPARNASSIRTRQRPARPAGPPRTGRPEPSRPSAKPARANPAPARLRVLPERSSPSPVPEPPRRLLHAPSAANVSGRTSALSASLPGSAVRAATFRSRKCTTPTAFACRRSWPPPVWPHAASARR